MNSFKAMSREELSEMVTTRPGETRLGEKVQVPDTIHWEDAIKHTTADYVLVGIPEDIGVRANHGVGGAHTAWLPALKAILNTQETELLQGDRLLVSGYFDFSDWMAASANASVEQLRATVAQMDDIIFPVIECIAAAGKIPVVIGGGHNNAFPILKGVRRGRGQALNCINLDAHSDYRVMEGRHSGNGFRYAKTEGYLNRYAIIGLHRNYNSASVLNELQSDPHIRFSFYEDIFLQQKQDFHSAVAEAIRFTEDSFTGIELDMDCIENMLSSAATPCGITPLQARQYIYDCRKYLKTAYLHITEGAVQLADGRTSAATGKMMAYLVTDFIRRQLP